MNTINLIHRFKIVILASAVSALVVAAGCMSAVNDYTSSLPAGLDKTIKATNIAVTQLAFVKVNEDKQLTSDDFTARDPQDKKIEIRLETAGDNVTKVTIHVGELGDQDASVAIFEKIKAAL